MFNKLLTPLIISLTALTPVAQADTTQLFWGDTHLHTSYSGDAFALGNETADPDTAYRFAKGLPVIHPYNRARVQLERPLDFLVIAEHAEYMGLLQLIGENNQRLQNSEIGKQLSALWEEKGGKAVYYQLAGSVVKNAPYKELTGEALLKPIWERIINAAEQHNEPGKFTAFIGWEWSSLPGGANLHRIVFTDDGGDVARQFVPYSSIDSDRPEDLWNWLDQTSKRIGTDFVAIPHNSNISKGLMFNKVDSNGHPISADYARTRMKWEPVAEVTQIKGDSETHPRLSPDDPFADFETYDHTMDFNIEGAAEGDEQGNYMRSGLKRGLVLESQTDTNPYKFGAIGSTDSHSSLSTASEPNFWGKFALDSIPENKHMETAPGANGWDMSASGMAAAWAKENTRASIFEAFKRKEVYATTGPRIELRFFGGFNYASGDAKAKDLAKTGYTKGVPMGGDLSQAPKGKAPSFLIHAVKDPMGANLDRIQVVKGWVDDDGEAQEKVFNVSLSNKRKDMGNNTQAVGNTVDPATGTYENSIGATQLTTVWTDPQFDPKQRAFYYTRVLQIPTPRHSLYDGLALGMTAEQTNKPASIQERAYSSPIWYTP